MVQRGGVMFAFNRWGMLRLLAGLLVAAGFALSLVIPRWELPFHLHAEAGAGVVAARSGMPLPAALHSGDRVPFDRQSAQVRAMLSNENVPGDRAYLLQVQRGSDHLVIAVHTVQRRNLHVHRPQWWAEWTEQTLLLLLGLLTLWRGRDWAAWGLALLALSITLGNVLQALPVAPFANLALQVLEQWFYGPSTFLGLFCTATALVGRRVQFRRGLGLLYLLLLSALFVIEAGGQLSFVFTAAYEVPALLQWLLVVLELAGLGIPLVILVRGYFHAAVEARLRIRWILSGTLLLLPLMLIQLLLRNSALQGSPALQTWLRAIYTTLSGGVLALYTYAVLRQRLVEVRVVINRALVFALLMGLVVGLFALMESLIERSAIGESAGLALEIGVPLALGILFHQLHRRIEALVDRVFFHREHRARQALADFARDAGFIESPQTLIARAVEAFGRDAGVVGAALYEARDAGFECGGRDGAGPAFPGHLDQDDPALVRLRATLQPLDLHGIGSALGCEGLALPLALRGHLFGVLMCGPRPAGRHAQADIERLGHAAHEVGASLFALRARANERLIEALALGALSPAQATLQARELAGVGVP